MSLFDAVVDRVLGENPELTPLRAVVEKELLHRSILRVMADSDLLTDLTFIGGTCLRMCHRSPRLSEDLDFATAIDADAIPQHLASLGCVVGDALDAQYGHVVRVSEPRAISGLVRTWKISMVTYPQRPDLPAQRIHIDVQALAAIDIRPSALLDVYRVDAGSAGIIVRAATRSEIFADKVVAFAMRDNRVRNRDIWDIGWLAQQGVSPEPAVIIAKLASRNTSVHAFRARADERVDALHSGREQFMTEMRRFLPPAMIDPIDDGGDYWDYVTDTLRRCVAAVVA